MSQLRHSNIITLLGVVIDEEHDIAMVTELAGLGTLRHCLKSPAVHTEWANPKRRWAEEIASAIAYLHGARYMDFECGEKATGIVHVSFERSRNR